MDPEVALRSWRASDLPFFTELRNDTAAQRAMLSDLQGATVQQVLAWLRRKAADNAVDFCVAELRPTGEPIGFVQWSLDPAVAGTFWLGMGLGASYRGRGLGMTVGRRAMQMLQQVRGARKALLKVDSENTRARRLYTGLGFRELDYLESHVEIDGIFRDVIVMGRDVDDRGSGLRDLDVPAAENQQVGDTR